MATQKSRTSAGRTSARSRLRRRVLTAAAVGVAAGVATLAVAKGLETPRGRALKRKALSKGRKVGRNVLGDVEKAAVASAMANMKLRTAGAGATAGTPSGAQRAARKTGGTRSPARKTSGTKRTARKASGTKSAARKTASRAR